MRFITVAWRNLTRRPIRSTLTIVGLSVAVAAAVSLLGVSRGFEQSFINLYIQRGADLVVQRTGGMVQLSSGVDESLGPRIRALPGVRKVVGSLMDVVAFEEYDLFAVIVNGWPPDSPVLDQVNIVAGRRLRAGDHQKVMLGEISAKNLDKKVGDKIPLYAEEFEVIGIFESFSIYESGGIFMLLSDLQRLMDRPHKVTGYVVQTEQPDEPDFVAAVAKQIEALDPALSAMPMREFVRNINEIRAARIVARITSAVALIIGAIGILNTMIMSVFERPREIGALRAIGWPKSRVIRMILCEALFLGLGGAILGTLGGAAIMRILAHLPTTAGLIEGHLDAAVLYQGLPLALLLCLAGAFYPAWWAASLQPVDALRRK